MFDAKIETLLEVISAGSYTRAAQRLSLTQPAVSHHMRQLEQEFGIHIFYKDKKELRLTPEGEILVKYARRALAVYRNARQAIEDSRICMSHIGVGITHTVGESCVPQVLAEYCNQTPGVHINIVTDTIKNLYDMMRSYELDVAIVDGQFPASGYTEVLLDTDYLCLVVSPIHPLARRASVAIGALQGERFIMRARCLRVICPNAGRISGTSISSSRWTVSPPSRSLSRRIWAFPSSPTAPAARTSRRAAWQSSRWRSRAWCGASIWCIIRIFPIRRSWRSCAVYISAGAEPGEARKKAKK